MVREMKSATRNYIVRQLSPERGFDLIRMYLGVGLLVRGVLFFLDPSFVGDLIHADGATSLVPRLIALGHVLGGALLAVGLYTRLAATVQLVPVLGALLVVHSREHLASADQGLEFSALVMVMLIFFAWFGAGRWSVDARRRGDRAESVPLRDEVPLQQGQIQVGVDRKLL
jgi:putative oxidoreductase